MRSTASWKVWQPLIPTMILVGLALGFLVHDERSLVRSAVLGGCAALLWGMLVGLSDARLATAVGGTVLALVNAGVGAALGAAIRLGLASIAGRRA